ncbi:hypothetical protein V8E36_005946 [Tilletia maclaganii]
MMNSPARLRYVRCSLTSTTFVDVKSNHKLLSLFLSLSPLRMATNGSWAEGRRRVRRDSSSMLRPGSSSSGVESSFPSIAVSAPSSPSSSWAHLPTAPRRTTTARRHRKLAADDEDIDHVYGARSSSPHIRTTSPGGSSSRATTPTWRTTLEPPAYHRRYQSFSPTPPPPSAPPVSPLHAAAEAGARAGNRARAFLTEFGLSSQPGPHRSGTSDSLPFLSRLEELRNRFPSTAGTSWSTPTTPLASSSSLPTRKRPTSHAPNVGSERAPGPALPERPGYRASKSASTSRRSSYDEHSYESLYGTQYFSGAAHASFVGAQVMSEEALMRTMSVAQMQLASAGNLARTLTRQLSEPLQPIFQVSLLIGISVATMLSLVAFMTIGYGLSIWDDVSHRAGLIAAASASNPSAKLIRQSARKNVEASVRWGKRMLAGTFERPYFDQPLPQPWSGSGFSRSTQSRRMRTGSMPSHVPASALHAQTAASGSSWEHAKTGSRAASPTGDGDRSGEEGRTPGGGYDLGGEEATTAGAFPPRPPLSVLIPSILVTLLIALGALLLRIFIQRQNDAAAAREAAAFKAAKGRAMNSTALTLTKPSPLSSKPPSPSLSQRRGPSRQGSWIGEERGASDWSRRSSHEESRSSTSHSSSYTSTNGRREVEGGAGISSGSSNNVRRSRPHSGHHSFGPVDVLAAGGNTATPLSFHRRTSGIRAG